MERVGSAFGRELRVVAVGRKDWLFAGSMAGAHRAALLYSLLQSCTLVVRTRLGAMPASERQPLTVVSREVTHS